MPVGIQRPASVPLKTLVVEDDFTSRLLLQTFLARYGECHVAVDGKEAVKAFQIASDHGSPYNLVCMDILLPTMNGTEAVKQIRKLQESRGIPSARAAKIIMTTGVSDMNEVFRSFDQSCDAYLFKPIDTAKLLKELEIFGLLE